MPRKKDTTKENVLNFPKKPAAAKKKSTAKKKPSEKKDTTSGAASSDDEQEPLEEFRAPTENEIADGEPIHEDLEGDVFLPGMEPPRNTALEAAAKKYARFRDDRMKLAKKEKEAKEFLIQLMKRDRVPLYQFDGLDVKLSNKPDVTVREHKDEDPEDEENVESGEESGEETVEE